MNARPAAKMVENMSARTENSHFAYAARRARQQNFCLNVTVSVIGMWLA